MGAENGQPTLDYLRISPTDGLANKTNFAIEVRLEGNAEYVFIDLKDDGEWGYTEYFFTHPSNRYTYERMFERVAVREYRIFAQSKDGQNVLLHEGNLRIKNEGNEIGVLEIQSSSGGSNIHVDVTDSDDIHKDDTQQLTSDALNHDQQPQPEAPKNDQNIPIKFRINKLVPECIFKEQLGPVSFLVSCSGVKKNTDVKYSGYLSLGNEQLSNFGLKVEDENILSFCLEDIADFKEGVYSLTILADNSEANCMDSCLTIAKRMNACRFEMENIVIEADTIIDSVTTPEIKRASGNVLINGQINCTSDLEINTRYKSIKGDGTLYINCKGYTSADSYTPFTICDKGTFNISAVTGEIKLENSEKFAYLAGNKFDIKSYTITKDDGLNIDFKLFGFTDMLRVLIQDSESLKYLPKLKTFSVSANIKDNIFRVITDVEGKIPCLYKFSGIKFLKFFEFGDLKFKYDSEEDIFTSEAAVKIGNSKSKFLPALPQLQLIGGIAIKDGKAGINKIAGKGAGYNAPIDSTGVFLHSAELSAHNMFTKPFTISLLSELTAGPKVKVLSKNYALLTIYDAGIELNVTDLEASLVGKLKLLNFDQELSSCKATISYKDGATFEANVNLIVIEGKLYLWFKSPDDFGGKIQGYLVIPGKVPVIGGKTISGAEFTIENSDKRGLYAYSNINLWKDVSFCAEYYFQTNELKIASNWFGNKAVARAYTPVDKDERTFAWLGEPNLELIDNDYMELDVPEGISNALIKIVWEGEDTDFGLVLPDGTVIKHYEAQASSDKFFYLKNSACNEASYFLDTPEGGRYRIFSDKLATVIKSAELYNINQCPKIKNIYLTKSEQGKVMIHWNMEDDDEQHDISLYYDTDNDDYNGELITESLSLIGMDGKFEWDVTDLIKGNYYIYVKVSDGVNAPVLAYSLNSIETGDKNGLPAPENLIAYSNGKGLHLLWDDIANHDNGYIVQILSVGKDSELIKELMCFNNECLVDVERGLTYLVRVRTMDNEKTVSNLYSEYEIHHMEYSSSNIQIDEFPEGTTNVAVACVKGENPDKLPLCIKLNGNAVCEFSDMNFNIPIELREGVNYLSLECVNDGVAEEIHMGKVILSSNPPYLNVNSIKDGYATFEDSVSILGEADTQYVQINGKQIIVENGSFHETFSIQKGDNTIKIVAINELGLHTSKTFNVIGMDKEALRTKYYSDIEGHWAQDVIERMRSNGIMSDRDFKEFAPDKPVTRGEIAAFIVKLLDIKEQYEIQPFKDVNFTHPFREHIIKAYNNGIIQGYEQEYFPNNNITRQDLCVILSRVLGYRQIPCVKSEELPFKDKQSISTYAMESVGAAYQHGLVKGKPDWVFDPMANATRAEMAVVLERLMEVLSQ